MPDTHNLPVNDELPSHPTLVYGWPGGELAFAPREEAMLYASMRRGEGFPMTWGAFRSRFGERAYQVSVEPFVEQAAYASFAEFLKDFDADYYDCSAEDAYKELPMGEDGRPPADDDIAAFMDCEGNVENTPEVIRYWPAQLMLNWFPQQLAREYGRVRDSVHDGEFLELDGRRCEDIIAALEALGYLCVKDDKLMDIASDY